MASTRDFKSLGIFAADANTVIPPTPIVGDSYRDIATTISNNRRGEEYDTVPNSALFNQKMLIISSFTNILDTQGMIGWTDLVDYIIPAYVAGSDGFLYFALLPSGPAGVGAKDPITEPAYWKLLINDDSLNAFIAVLAGTTGAGLVGTTSAQTTQFELDKNAADLQNYKNLLISNSGASNVKTTSGDTVQEELDKNVVKVFATTHHNSVITSPAANHFVVTFDIPAPNANYALTWSVNWGHSNNVAAYEVGVSVKTATHFEIIGLNSLNIGALEFAVFI